MIDFSIEPEFQAKLDWVRKFVDEEVVLMDALFDDTHHAPYDHTNKTAYAILRPLQEEVKRQGLWGMHLPVDLGGPGFSTVQLCLLNEILGRTVWGPVVFGCQAPDSGNSEILARFGNEEQKARFLQPLLDGEIYSTFSMTEVEGGSDPTQFRTSAVLDGDEWVINGEKWFSSNADVASFLIVLAVTDPDAPRYNRMSMLLVPSDTPGVELVRGVGLAGEPYEKGSHMHVRYNNVRVPASAMLGPRGGGFMVAQSRLGGGRIHHAMRTIGMCRHALDMMCERALSRVTQGETLSRKQLVQSDVGECWIELEQFRLLVLRTAWMFDQHMEEDARAWIAACKVACAEISHKILFKAMHTIGSLGISNMTPLARAWSSMLAMGMADGPTEIHRMYAGRHELKRHKGTDGAFPTEYLPDLRRRAIEKFAPRLPAGALEGME